MTRKSFSVRIFLQDGCADGVKIVSRSKWSGRGLVSPRSALAAELDRAELKDPGVYLLSAPAAAADEAPAVPEGATVHVVATSHLDTQWRWTVRDTIRDFWRGEPSTLAEFGYRFTGSSDLYEADTRRPTSSINFVTAHDGFTLGDLVSYNDKHNEANGEDGNDGDGRLDDREVDEPIIRTYD